MKRLLVCLLLVGVLGCVKKKQGTGQQSEPPRAQNKSPKPPPVETDANKAEAELNKGNNFAYREDWAPAIACFTEAIRLDPDLAVAYYNRGLAYLKKGQSDKAIADFTEAIRIVPDYAKAYYSRGVAYQELGDQVKADADFAKAKELDCKP